jgi:hypothetical protein
MPKIDFTTIDDAQDFSPIPEGKYLCRLAEVEEAHTRDGDDRWKLRFEVLEGPYQGRKIFDDLFFSAKALKRVKFVCSRLGLDVSAQGEFDLQPDHILDRVAYVTVEIEEYEDDHGVTKKRNKVPFAGYERVEEGRQESHGTAVSEDAGEQRLPF